MRSIGELTIRNFGETIFVYFPTEKSSMQVVVSSALSIMCTKEPRESKWATIFLWRTEKEKRGH